jgi:hypothetical protein
MDIIRSEAGQHLREELARSSDKIIANAFPQAIRKPNESTNSAWMSYVARNNYALVSSRTGNSAGMQSTAESADQMPDKSNSRQARVLDEQFLSVEQVCRLLSFN